MQQIDGQLLSLEQDIKNANGVKQLVLEQLVRDNLITKDQSLEYIENWQVIMVKRSWFQQWWLKYGAGKPDGYIYNYVKFVK